MIALFLMAAAAVFSYLAAISFEAGGELIETPSKYRGSTVRQCGRGGLLFLLLALICAYAAGSI